MIQLKIINILIKFAQFHYYILLLYLSKLKNLLIYVEFVLDIPSALAAVPTIIGRGGNPRIIKRYPAHIKKLFRSKKSSH